MKYNNMRGLFMIMKGQYTKGVKPNFINSVSGDEMSVGGYDPERPDTDEWYQLMDRKNYTIICCSGDLDKVLKGVSRSLTLSKGKATNYFRCTEGFINPCPSPVMRCLYEHVEELYGDYFNDRIKEMEDLAYSELREEKPVLKNRKLMSKHKKEREKVEMEEPKIEVVEELKTPKKLKPKVVLGIKKLNM